MGSHRTTKNALENDKSLLECSGIFENALEFFVPSWFLQNLKELSETPSILLVSRVRRVRSILNENHLWGQLYIRVRRVRSVRSMIYLVD